MVSKEEAKEALNRLIAIYEKHKDDKQFVKNERQVCDSLIRPFFEKVLGWDTSDPSEFKTEYSQNGKRIDYLVCLDDISQFVIEAKALTHDIRRNAGYYNQAIQYAHSKDRKFAILTNFKHFIILESDVKVDNPIKAEIDSIDITDFSEDQFNVLLGLNRETWIKLGENNPAFPRLNLKKRDKIDEELLEDMKRWRETFLTQLKKHSKANNFDFSNPKELEYVEEEVQRFIDRLIFICFCEDKSLEDNKLKSLLIDKRDRYSGKPYLLGKIRDLFSEYRKAYNSDLFDEKGYCDKFYVEDLTLYNILKDLREPDNKPFPYDFSIIEADILGRVYENFIGHLTSGKKRFKEKESKGKRKEQGIYYTPTYIVDYIVKNTLGELLKTKSVAELKDIKVLDPACGSGSFLIKAFEVLDSHYEKKSGFTTEFRKNDILRNNIFGVDLDPKAVEITRFNLMLRAARKHLKLPMLHDNIKCGNSLIDDPEVAGQDKAFKWEERFKEIMDNGGFDVIIGNPPWLMAGYHITNKEIEFLHRNYESAKGKFDMYYCFIEKGLKLLSKNGVFGMIVPNKFFHTKSAKNLRRVLIESGRLYKIIDFGYEKIFGDATNYSSIILLKHGDHKKITHIHMDTDLHTKKEIQIDTNILTDEGWYFEDKVEKSIFEKIESIGTPLKDITKRFGTGTQTGADKLFLITEEKLREFVENRKIFCRILRGRDVRRYSVSKTVKFAIFPYKIDDGEFKILNEDEIRKYRKVWRLLESNKGDLSTRVWFGKNATQLSGKWYGFMYLDRRNAFTTPHILTPSLSNRSNFALGTGDLFVTGTAGVTSIILDKISEDIRYILGLLNSKLISFYVIKHSPVFQGGYHKFSCELPAAKAAGVHA